MFNYEVINIVLFQIKCTRRPYCSGYPITVTITDECPGACNNVPYHFDLGRTAFGAMANPGRADDLRNLGQVDIQYRRFIHYIYALSGKI